MEKKHALADEDAAKDSEDQLHPHDGAALFDDSDSF
jgi:hypothetical protein